MRKTTRVGRRRGGAKRSKISGGTVLAFQNQQHTLLKKGDVVWEGDRIIYVGQSFADEVDEVLDGRGRLVLPGLINLHVHAGVERQAFMLDLGRKDLFGSGILVTAIPQSKKSPFNEKDCRTGAVFALSQLLKNGTTTVMHLGPGSQECEIMAEEAERIGIRAYIGSEFKSASWQLDEQGRLFYKWTEKAGDRGLKEAVDFVQRHKKNDKARVLGCLYPLSVDTCSPELLRDGKKEARRLNVPIHTHAAQTLIELHEVLRRFRETPVQHLDQLGFLDQGTILGHCIFTSGHRMAAFPNADDLQKIARSGATVAHCPLVFARRGIALDSLARYLKNGINMGLGTDTIPFDIFHEMRIASLICKVMEGDFSVGRADELLNMVTLGGAKALGRRDLGRIEVGAKADLTALKMESLYMAPFIDPLRALLVSGSGHMVETVVVDGKAVVSAGRVGDLDEEALYREVQKIGQKFASAIVQNHRSRMSREELFPASLPAWRE